jgi:hypothetical protein
MKVHRNRLLALTAITLLAIGVCVSRTSAQSSSLRGSFTLPFEVSWQGNTLPAGDYTFSLMSPSLPATISVKGPQSAFIMATAIEEKRTDEKSSLTVQPRGNTRFVEELYLADLKLRIGYSVPKVPKAERELAQGPAPEHIAVAISGK